MSNTFSFDTIEEFDKHIDRSIPGYSTLQELIFPLATNFLSEGSTVIDIGCSTGELLKQLSYRNKTANFVGYDISDNLLPTESVERVDFFQEDVTDEFFKIQPNDLTLSIFTLQFLPKEKRQTLLWKIYKSLKPGGGFIIAEKLYCKDSKMQDYFQFSHYDMKRLVFSPDEILEKQRDLRRIMKPWGIDEFVNNIREAGFDLEKTELFWASFNFRAWVLIK